MNKKNERPANAWLNSICILFFWKSRSLCFSIYHFFAVSNAHLLIFFSIWYDVNVLKTILSTFFSSLVAIAIKVEFVFFLQVLSVHSIIIWWFFIIFFPVLFCIWINVKYFGFCFLYVRKLEWISFNNYSLFSNIVARRCILDIYLLFSINFDRFCALGLNKCMERFLTTNGWQFFGKTNFHVDR